MCRVRVFFAEDDRKLGRLLKRGLGELGMRVDVYVRYLREKVDGPFGVCAIETVHGTGYRLPASARRGAAFVRALAAVLVLSVLVPTTFALLRRHAAPPPRPVANHAFHGVGGDRRPVVVWALGDGAAGKPAATWLAARVAADRPARVLYLGDVYESGTAEEFREHMGGAYGRLLSRILPTPGNHDWPKHLTGYDPYWKRITGAATPPWYAVRIGGWQVLSLNSEAPHDDGSAQLRWLRRQLRGRSTCRLAFWHRPRFSAGRHGDQDDVGPLWNALVGRAALVLNGHDHDVQRLHPIEGTTELVSGAGGESHYAVDADDERLAFADDRADAALRLVLHPRHADVAVVDAGGRVLDRSSAPCAG